MTVLRSYGPKDQVGEASRFASSKLGKARRSAYQKQSGDAAPTWALNVYAAFGPDDPLLNTHIPQDFSWFEIRFASTVSAVHRSPCDSDSSQTARIGLRKTAFVLLSTIGAISALGEDLTTTTGKTYHDIQVLSRSSSDVLIQSKEGEFQFSLSELKPGDRERYSKNLTKAIDLPALTVLGEQKADFTTPQEPTRTEKFAQKEIQRQETEKDEAHKKQLESYQPFQVFRGLTFSLVTDPKNDAATLPDYLSPDYGRQSPDIVEKDLKIFANSINNPSP